MNSAVMPLVSIITPSFNQGRFIRETIESVRNQGYPHVEHIVIDGGSTDDTVAILQYYQSILGERFRFVSEPDRGQSHAINKGLAMAKGEIIGWVNSDDTYAPGAIQKAVHTLVQHPEWAIVAGICQVINENSEVQSVIHMDQIDYRSLFYNCCIAQPTAFLRKHVFHQVGGVDESLRFCMDYDLWIRIAKNHKIGFINQHLANARVHASCKSATLWNTVGIPEVLKTVIKHYGKLSTNWASYVHKLGISFIMEQCKKLAMFGPTARITSMNRYNDLWVPPVFRVSVESEPGAIYSLVVKGSVPLPYPAAAIPKTTFQCSVLVNGRLSGNHQTSLPNFTWIIPLEQGASRHEVTFYSSQFILQNGSKAVSFMALEVHPLSTEEHHFYQLITRPGSLYLHG